uniref:F-box domain-containing protein n=1 Tax=Oryza punctata TaxID=4537 RepID=A0A0E0LM56_ORYPU
MAWACLPFDLLCEITRRIPCEVDRVSLQRVCRSWRAFAMELEALPLSLPPPSKLPWLLLPSSVEPNSSCLLSGINDIGRVHRVRVPDDLLSARLHELEDVIYYDNSFCFLSGWDLVIVVPALDHGELILHRERRLLRRPEHTYQLTPQRFQLQAASQYLVESRGELLLVIKKNPKARSMFTVFKMTETDGNGVDGAIRYRWSDVTSLDGRMLFVGHGCFRSYEATDFPGFQEGIYFLDDQWFFQYRIDSINQMLRSRRSDNIMAGTHQDRLPWSRCFPLEHDTCGYSSPIWLL